MNSKLMIAWIHDTFWEHTLGSLCLNYLVIESNHSYLCAFSFSVSVEEVAMIRYHEHSDYMFLHFWFFLFHAYFVFQTIPKTQKCFYTTSACFVKPSSFHL
jgi:hypothetical protein